MNTPNKQTQQRSRLGLIALIAVFLLPILTAYIFHKFPQLQPGTTKNNGILFKPVVVLEKFGFLNNDGKAYGIKQLRGKWALVYIGGEECAKSCQETLFKARNGIIAQGKEGSRVKYFYISTGKKHGQPEMLKNEHKGLILLNAPEGESVHMLSPFSIDKAHKPGSDNRLYLIDPAGNLLMHYPSGFKDLGLMEDLKHLLKWSQIG